jgi:hypothetical protein
VFIYAHLQNMQVILAFLFLFFPLSAAQPEEIDVVEQLITTTKKNLDAQQRLLQMMIAYNQAKESFLEDPDSSKLATSLVRKSMLLHHHIMQEHLSHLFSTDFLVELSFFNQVGKNQLTHQP